MKAFDELKAYVRLFVEAKVREADVSDGRRVTFASDDHVDDLNSRINDLVAWRDRSPRGTEQRANYARLVNRLRAELASAMRRREQKTT